MLLKNVLDIVLGFLLPAQLLRPSVTCGVRHKADAALDRDAQSE